MNDRDKNMSAVVQVTIDEDGNTSTLVINTCEDLLHDFEYFLRQAKANSADEPESMFIHRRFLRAASLMLFAYADAVVNGWVELLLTEHPNEFLQKRRSYACLTNKIDYLDTISSGKIAKPDMKAAKDFRNLFVHFTPTSKNEEIAFSSLSVTVIKNAAQELNRWMSGIETTLNLTRHANSAELMRGFTDLGTVTRDSSSDSSR